MKLSEELSLLIEICFTEAEQISPATPVNWKRLYELSIQHGVMALLCHNVSRLTSAPPEFISNLKFNGRSLAMFNLKASQRLLEVYQALQQAGVPSFPMKGPFWAEFFYGNAGLRSFGDLDFFIDDRHFDTAVRAMENLGFELDPYRKYLIHKNGQSTAYIRSDYQLALLTNYPDHEIQLIELQWRNAYPRFGAFFSYDDLMKQPLQVEFAGTMIAAPSLECQLVVMAIHHGSVEQWDRLKYLADLIFFLRKFGRKINWDEARKRAEKMGLLEILKDGLTLAVGIAKDLRIPGEFLQKDRPNTHWNVLIDIWENGRPKSMTKSWQIFSYNLRNRDSFQHKANLVTRHAAYLLEWPLLWHKYRWYFGKGAKLPRE